MNLLFFLSISKYRFSKKSWYKKISKISNVTFIFQNFQTFFQNRKKEIEKIQTDSKKSINSFEIKKG